MHVAVLIIVSTIGVKGMGNFMSNHDTDTTIVLFSTLVLVIKWRLQNTSWEVDAVAFWVVIGIDIKSRTRPFILINRIIKMINGITFSELGNVF